MKMTKLSLVAAMAMTAAFAGGDIAPVEPVVEACNADTTINGKAQAYYFTNNQGLSYRGNNRSMFEADSSDLGLAVTLDVSHKIYDGITANVSAVGYLNTMNGHSAINGFESTGVDAINAAIAPLSIDRKDAGAFINVANITATFGDTTFVLGRQLLNTPMLSGFDWLLAPGSFEAYTLVNTSIENVTFIASYVEEWRPNNLDDTWVNLSDASDGDNWTVSAAYNNDALKASIWYYNIDAGFAIRPEAYTQVYVDAGYNFGSFALDAMYVNTDYSNTPAGLSVDASDAYGIKATATLGSVELMAAYVNVSDNVVGFVGAMDNLYTSSWNSNTSLSIGDNFKVEASTTLWDVRASASYAYYEYDNNDIIDFDNGQEIDVILGYDITNCISVDAIYTNTNYGYTGNANLLGDTENVDALELIATYKF
ncbi:MAG: porin [Sulfurovum sp.]|nr:porin [Sulfurovum sp.]